MKAPAKIPPQRVFTSIDPARGPDLVVERGVGFMIGAPFGLRKFAVVYDHAARAAELAAESIDRLARAWKAWKPRGRTNRRRRLDHDERARRKRWEREQIRRRRLRVNRRIDVPW